MLPNLACSLILSILLSCSQDGRDAHQLCSGEDGCAQRRDQVGGVFPRRDEDCVWIGRQDDQSLGFRCAFALKSPLLLAKLMPAGLSGRQTGADEREDERAQRMDLVGGVFPRRDQDRVGIGRQDHQSLGVWCAANSNHAPPWPKLIPAGLSGRQAGDAEREDERPQRLHQLGRVFPRRDQDCVGIARQDDQSLGFGCAFLPSKSPLLGQN